MKREQRTVGCFVEQGEKFLLLHRVSTKPQGNTWGLPAGKPERGESDAAAMRRELYEETGIMCREQDLALLGIYHFQFPDFDLTFPTFKLDLIESHTIQINGSEHQAYEWLTAQELYEKPGLMDGLQDLLTRVGYV